MNRRTAEARRIAAALELQQSSVVADVGAGDGRYAFPLAREVVTSGRVFAVEIDRRKLTKLRRRQLKEPFPNLTVIESQATGAGLSPRSCDAVFLRGSYHHVTQPALFLASLRESLRPGGRLLVVDFPPTWWLGPWTPKGLPADRKGHGIEADTVIREARAAGFELVRQPEEWARRPFSRLFVVQFRVTAHT